MEDEQKELEELVAKNGKLITIFGKTISVPEWVVKRLVPILLLLLVVGIVALVYYMYNYQPDQIDKIQKLGYIGIFIISLIMNATLILPVGNVVVMAAMAPVLPPIVIINFSIPTFICIGVIGGIAAAIGESTGYLAGFSGQSFVGDDKKKKIYAKLENWLGKYGMFLIIVMSIVPLAFDIMGLVAGVLKYPYKKFLIATAIGRMIMYSLVCWAFVTGFDFIINLVG